MAPDITVAEAIEAQCRELMASLTSARGWDTQRERDDELTHLDTLLDAYNEAQR